MGFDLKMLLARFFGPMDRRMEDMSAEAALGSFLDKYLYGRFPNMDAFSSIRREHDREAQRLGTDVIFLGTDGREYRVDEKAQLYYLNKDLPTFAFELQYLRDSIPRTGWLVSEDLKTDLYLLIWPFASRDDPAGIRMEDFTRADCLLIRKKALLRMLEAYGLTRERLLEDAAGLRAQGSTGKQPISGLPGIYYYVSDPQRYREAPINLVISKERLLKLCQRRYIVTPGEVITR